MGYIYILSSPIGKSYIGQTFRTIEERLKEHETGKSSGCVAIYNAIKKYGWENLEKDWYECPDEDLNKHEELMVEVLGTLSPDGYNLKEGGANGKPSEETKQKMSEAHLGEKNHNYGKTMSEEQKQKISEAQFGERSHMYGKTGEKNYFFGKIHTEETKQKMSEAKLGEKNHFWGKTHTEETKKNIGESLSGEKNPNFGKTGEKNHNSKRVYQYDIDGNLLRSFGSTEEAQRYLNKPDGTCIRKCTRGVKGRKTAYGFKWSYTN